MDCKAKQIAELSDALEKATQEVKSERGRTRDVEHMLAGEKKLAAKLREDLESAKKQLSDDKDKLCNALKQKSVLIAQVSGVNSLTECMHCGYLAQLWAVSCERQQHHGATQDEQLFLHYQVYH